MPDRRKYELQPCEDTLASDGLSTEHGTRLLKSDDGANHKAVTEENLNKVVECAHTDPTCRIVRDKSRLGNLRVFLHDLEAKYLNLKRDYFALFDQYGHFVLTHQLPSSFGAGLESSSSASSHPKVRDTVSLERADKRYKRGNDGSTSRQLLNIEEINEFSLEKDVAKWDTSSSLARDSFQHLQQTESEKHEELDASVLEEGAMYNHTHTDTTSDKVCLSTERTELIALPGCKERTMEMPNGVEEGSYNEGSYSGADFWPSGTGSGPSSLGVSTNDVREASPQTQWALGIIKRCRISRCEKKYLGIANRGDKMAQPAYEKIRKMDTLLQRKNRGEPNEDDKGTAPIRDEWTYGMIRKTAKQVRGKNGGDPNEGDEKTISAKLQWSYGMIRKTGNQKLEKDIGKRNEGDVEMDHVHLSSNSIIGFHRFARAVENPSNQIVKPRIIRTMRNKRCDFISNSNAKTSKGLVRERKESNFVSERGDRLLHSPSVSPSQELTGVKSAAFSGSRISERQFVFKTLGFPVSNRIYNSLNHTQQRSPSSHTKKNRTKLIAKSKKAFLFLRWKKKKGSEFAQKKVDNNRATNKIPASVFVYQKGLKSSGKGRSSEKELKASPVEKEETSEANDKLTNEPSAPCWAINLSDIRFIEKLGSGKSATVYLGVLEGKKVAIKVLKQNNSKQDLEDFKGEMKIMSSLSSPQIVKFYGASLAPRLCIVLEYCPNGSLFHYMRNLRNRFNWGLLFKFMHEIVRGIDTLHRWNPQIFHRDLKSLNLLLDAKLNLKVCDFGLSRFVSLERNQKTFYNTRGTYAYYDPEVYRGGGFTAKSDIYSIGIILWEMVSRLICGRYCRPYSEYPVIRHDFQIIVQSSRGLRPTLPSQAPRPLHDLYGACVNDVQDNRPTCEELEAAITNIERIYQKDVAYWNSLNSTSVNN